MGRSSLLASPQKPGGATIADRTELSSTTLLSCGLYMHTNYLSKIRHGHNSGKPVMVVPNSGTEAYSIGRATTFNKSLWLETQTFLKTLQGCYAKWMMCLSNFLQIFMSMFID